MIGGFRRVYSSQRMMLVESSAQAFGDWGCKQGLSRAAMRLLPSLEQRGLRQVASPRRSRSRWFHGLLALRV